MKIKNDPAKEAAEAKLQQVLSNQLRQRARRKVEFLAATVKATRLQKKITTAQVAAITKLDPKQIERFEQNGDAEIGVALMIIDAVCDGITEVLEAADQIY